MPPPPPRAPTAVRTRGSRYPLRGLVSTAAQPMPRPVEAQPYQASRAWSMSVTVAYGKCKNFPACASGLTRKASAAAYLTTTPRAHAGPSC